MIKFKDAIAAVVIGAVFAFILANGWILR